MRKASRWIGAALLGCVAWLPTANLHAQGRAVLVDRSTQSSVIEYTPGSYIPLSVLINSTPHLYFPEADLSHREGDRSPGLPRESFLIGIPPAGNVRLSIVREDWLNLGPVPLTAAPEIIVSDDSLRSVTQIFNPGVPAGPVTPTAWVEEINWLRYQRVARILVSPYRQNPRNGNLERLVSLAVRLQFPDAASLSAVAAVDDPFFEETYRELLVNYEQARQWRTLPVAEPTGAHDSSGQWFSTTSTYLRFPVAADGIYRVTYEQLLSTGLLPPLPDLASVDFHFKGKRISIERNGEEDGVFGPGDSFEFYGSSLYENGLERNGYSDTSVYWAAFAGSGNKSTQIDSLVAGTPDVTIGYFPSTIRLERDTFYYFGNGGVTINNTTGKVFGEGWYWRRLFANRSTSVQFSVPNLYTTGNPDFVVRGRLHSPVATSDTVFPKHHLEIRLNGIIIGSVQMEDNIDTLFAFPVSSTLFNAVQNTITIRSNPTATSINEVFLDWIEIDLLNTLEAQNDSLTFNASQAGPGQIALFQLTGFSVPDVFVYRIGPDGSLEKRFVGSVTGASTHYTFEFSDTVTAGRFYCAVTSSRKRTVTAISGKTFTGLRSPTNGADYLVIAAREFGAEASQLATYRQQQGVGRTRVVFVDDIFDEFSYGIFDPFAIQRFLRAVDTLWIPPMPAYVVIIGDANWDYKDNLMSGKRNFVPSLGNPVSDAWFVASDSDPFLPKKKVGRIPASTAAQASLFVQMLKEYEASALTSWNKRFLFMASGFDSVETARFRAFSEGLISNHIAKPPISGEATRLYKTSPVVDFEQTEEVRQILEQGAVWINFYGHAGADFWGNGLTDPLQFVNQDNKRHLITDISCSTVRFGEPLVESFSEKMIFGENGGAVAYMGVSGFGFESPLRRLATEFYRQLSADTVRELGEMLLNAKVLLRGQGLSLSSQQALQQMTLIGDPATRIRVAEQPDLALKADEIIVVPEQPSEVDQQVTLFVPVRNLGLHGPDTVEVRIADRSEGESPLVFDVPLSPVGLTDTLVVSHVNFRKPGLHVVSVEIDPMNSLVEESETNNTAQFSYFVGSGQVRTVLPLLSSSVHPDSVLLIIQNPNVPATEDWTAIFEIDTSATFTGPGKIVQAGIQQGTVSTRWVLPPGLLSDTTLYHWRAALTNGLDSTAWAVGFFVTSRNLRPSWLQDRPPLLGMSAGDGVLVGNSVKLLSQTKTLGAYSLGFVGTTGEHNAAIYVDSTNISQGLSGRGYNVAVINQHSGVLEFFGAFDIYSDVTDTTRAEPLIQFLQSIPYGKRVVIAIDDEGFRNKTERLNQAIEGVGSARIRSLGFRSSWAIIGWKGAPIGSVPEGLKLTGQGPVILSDTVLFQNVTGSFTSPVIGPASRWQSIGIDCDTIPGINTVKMDLMRTWADGTQDSVTGLPLSAGTLLAFLPDSIVKIRMRLRLSTDSLGLSPEVCRWWVDFERPPELVVNYRTVRVVQDSVLEGVDLSFRADVFNIGGVPADTVTVQLGSVENNVSSPFYQTVVGTLPAQDSISISANYTTAGKRGKRTFYLHADPGLKIRESTKADNRVSFSAFVVTDTIPPAFDVTFDGRRILEGDYVSARPEIRIAVNDNSPLPLTDPANVDLRLNGRRITLGANPDSLFEPASGSEKARVIYRPVLSRGNHSLSVEVRDATGNPADTMAYDVRFRVETETKLLNVVNLPNPFSHQTALTFQLGGTTQPEEGRVRIFTMGGRLIHEKIFLPGEIQLGFNSVVWNGRDRDGDQVANGVYFYKIIVRAGGKTVETTGKMARVR